jgi:hypothetical protein
MKTLRVLPICFSLLAKACRYSADPARDATAGDDGDLRKRGGDG